MAHEESNLVLNNLRTTLEMAEYGLRDLLSSDPKHHELGIRNLAMHGRSVTFVLQNLRSCKPDFDEWYAPIQQEMKSSELCRFFKDLRNEIEKRGAVRPTVVKTHIPAFDTSMLSLLPRPSHVKILGFFMGDQLGGSGWEVELPDGRKDKMYLNLPKELVVTERLFKDPPMDHLGKSLEGKSIQDLGRIYYDYLVSVVERAFQKYH